MKSWTKFLIIGWSIVSLGIIIISYQIMKKEYIQEDYEVSVILKTPQKISPNFELIAEPLFKDENIKEGNILLTKMEFVEVIKKAKGIEIQSKSIVKDKSIYLILPIYAFAIWMIPVTVFSLLGLLFTRRET